HVALCSLTAVARRLPYHSRLHPPSSLSSFFSTATAPTALYTLSLHDALPISSSTLSKLMIGMVGPNCSSCTTRDEGSGSITIDGRMKFPPDHSPVGNSPNSRTSAPEFLASWTSSAT